MYLVLTCFQLENNYLICFDLIDIDELSAKFLLELLENYEDVHIELERKLGIEYAESYKDYDETVDKISKWWKENKAEVRKRKAQVLDKEKDNLRTEKEFFHGKIARDFDSLDSEQSVIVDDLERHSFVAKNLIPTFSLRLRSIFKRKMMSRLKYLRYSFRNVDKQSLF